MCYYMKNRQTSLLGFVDGVDPKGNGLKLGAVGFKLSLSSSSSTLLQYILFFSVIIDNPHLLQRSKLASTCVLQWGHCKDRSLSLMDMSWCSVLSKLYLRMTRCSVSIFHHFSSSFFLLPFLFFLSADGETADLFSDREREEKRGWGRVCAWAIDY